MDTKTKKELDIIKQDVNSFFAALDQINGLYLDSIAAYKAWHEKIIAGQKDAAKKLGMSIEELDDTSFSYVKGDEEVENNDWQHTCTQKELKERLTVGGSNHFSLANMTIVLIFQYWEICRKKIAAQLEIDESLVQSDIMGDIRHLRNSILKHESIAYKKIRHCKIINDFSFGDPIKLTSNRMDEIIQIIREQLADDMKDFLVNYYANKS